jgi:hypothetical protein
MLAMYIASVTFYKCGFRSRTIAYIDNNIEMLGMLSKDCNVEDAIAVLKLAKEKVSEIRGM